MRNVVVMKWGTLYGPDYVNVLYSACRSNISGPFRFVCLTDDPREIVPEVECFPLPETGIPAEFRSRGGVWPKLSLFASSLCGIEGRILFIDLDMMIVGPLDPFFDHVGGLVCTDMGEGWRPGEVDAEPETGTCIFAFDAGGQPQILERFLADVEGALQTCRNEQEFVGRWARQVDFWPKGWVISFKRFLRQPIGLDLVLPPRRPPPGTRVVAFHGKPRPIDLVAAGAGFWDRLPHLGHGQVDWVRDYWIGHGGRLP